MSKEHATYAYDAALLALGALLILFAATGCKPQPACLEFNEYTGAPWYARHSSAGDVFCTQLESPEHYQQRLTDWKQS